MGPQVVPLPAIIVAIMVGVTNSIRSVNNAHLTVQLIYGQTTMVGPTSIWEAASRLDTQASGEPNPSERPATLDYEDNQTQTHSTTIKDVNEHIGQANVSSGGGQEQSDDQQQQVGDSVPPYMQHMTHILVILHCSVFITGLVGNALVCLSVYRNKSLQTVTNYYIVNLAVADFLVILICLPPTVYWDLTLTWNFGLVLCKLVPYLQVSTNWPTRKFLHSTTSLSVCLIVIVVPIRAASCLACFSCCGSILSALKLILMVLATKRASKQAPLIRARRSIKHLVCAVPYG